MSDEQQPRDTVLLPKGIILRAQLVVQCATLIAEPSDEHPDGVFCGNVLEGAADLTFEPGVVAEMAIECPACSKRISASEGRPIMAVLPVALLIGDEQEAIPVEPAEGEEVATCPECGGPVEADGEEDESEHGDVGEGDAGDATFVTVTPEDQGADVDGD